LDSILKRSKRYHEKFLDLINAFSNVAGYKINIQKPVAFPYTGNEQVKKEIRKTISFMISSKNM
jgi:hypothetical protein